MIYDESEIPEELKQYFEPTELGLESTFQEYINKLCDIFDEVKRVLKKTGTCWVNIGDTYGGSGAGTWQNIPDDVKSKEVYTLPYGGSSSSKMRGANWDKNLLNIPARFSIEMQNRGWILRNELIWHKPNCMPSSVSDRFTVDFEKIYFFVKSKNYYFETQYEPHKTFENRPPGIVRNRIYDYQGKHKTTKRTNKDGRGHSSIALSGRGDFYPLEGRNKRTVWTINTKPYSEAHFAVYPEELCETPIKAGCPEKGLVLDPFFGSGTTGIVALKQNKTFTGIELNPEYIRIAKKRLKPHLEQTKLEDDLWGVKTQE